MAPRSANPTETEQRLDQLERENARLKEAMGALAYLASTPPVRRGVCAPLDAMRVEFAGRLHNGAETRPHMADETREKVSA
jgi:hypothetical protein